MAYSYPLHPTRRQIPQDNVGGTLISPKGEMGAKVCGKASNLGATAAIDLLKGSGLIIQDFMKKVETAVEPAAFPFDLGFVLRVANQLDANKARCPR